MRPLLLVVWGMLVVVVDLHVEEYDVVVDAVGWLLMVYGLRQLRGQDAAFTAATVGAVLGGIGAVYQVVPASFTGVALREGLGLVETVAQTVVVIATCTGVARVLAHEPSLARQARTIRALIVALTVVLLAVLLSSGGISTTWVLRNPWMMLPLVAAVLAVTVWFLVLLWRVRDRPGLGGGPT